MLTGAPVSSRNRNRYDGPRSPCPCIPSSSHSADGGHWTALTPEEQDTAPAIQRGRSSLNGLTFTLRGGRELWVTDGQGRAVELTADFTSFLASYDMADVQAYPVPQGIRVEVYMLQLHHAAKENVRDGRSVFHDDDGPHGGLMKKGPATG